MSETEQKAEQAKEAAAEMGKKLTGFLGGLAEKAKNIDVKELAEKAKSKVGEVQAKAGELTAGKTQSFATPREDVTADQMKEIFQKIGPSMTAPFSAPMETVLADALLGAAPDVKMTSAENDGVGLALTKTSLVYLSKTGDQYGATVVPVRKIVKTLLLPPRGDVAGRLSFETDSHEIKFPLVSVDAYCKAILFYKKFIENSAK